MSEKCENCKHWIFEENIETNLFGFFKIGKCFKIQVIKEHDDKCEKFEEKRV